MLWRARETTAHRRVHKQAVERHAAATGAPYIAKVIIAHRNAAATAAVLIARVKNAHLAAHT